MQNGVGWTKKVKFSKCFLQRILQNVAVSSKVDVQTYFLESGAINNNSEIVYNSEEAFSLQLFFFEYRWVRFTPFSSNFCCWWWRSKTSQRSAFPEFVFRLSVIYFFWIVTAGFHLVLQVLEGVKVALTPLVQVKTRIWVTLHFLGTAAFRIMTLMTVDKEKVETMRPLLRTKRSVIHKSTKQKIRSRKLQIDKFDSSLPDNSHYFRQSEDVAPQIQASRLLETFTLEVLWESVNQFWEEIQKWFTARPEEKKKSLLKSQRAEIYSEPTASLHDEGRFVAAGFTVWNTWRVGSYSLSGLDLDSPTDLVTSEVTHHSFRASWTAPGSPVDKYRVTYMTVAGGPTQEVRYSFLPLPSSSSFSCWS